MSTINVAAARPRRLLFVHEQWTLEVQRWQAIDRDLFHPVLSYISGRDNIFRYLTEMDNQGHLLTQAERILSHPGTPSTAFEAIDGHWVAQTTIQELSTPSAQAAVPPSQANGILEHLNRLQERLDSLERRLQGRIADNDAPSPSVRPMNEEFDKAENMSPPPGEENNDDEAESVSQAG